MKNIFFLISCFIVYTSYSQLQLSSGLSWKSNASTYVVLDNLGLQHDMATASLDNIFKFTGSTDVSINGNTLPSFTTIQLAKNGTSKLILQRNISALSISFQSGLIDLNNNNIDLGTTGQLNNETEASHIIGPNGGYVQVINTLNAPNNSNAGNLGAIISSSQILGSVTIRRGHVSQKNGSGMGNSVLRYFDITPSNNAALNATLRFVYLDAELNGIDENALVLWKSDNLITWSNQGYNSKDNQFNYVEKTGINNFSRWTLSTSNNPLPVLWNSFNTICQNNRTRISWETLSEYNTQSFIILKSNDGMNWIPLITIPAAGNSSSTHKYSYTDIQNGNLFYKVQQVDVNGITSFSPVLKNACNSNEIFQVYPNPGKDVLWITLQWGIGPTHLFLYDAKGALVKQQQENLQSGVNVFTFNISPYPVGSYSLLVKDQHGRAKTVKIQKD